MEIAELFVKLALDATEYAKGLTDAARGATSWVGDVGKTVAGLGAAAVTGGALLAAGAVAGIGVAAVDIASQVKQSQNDIQASLGVTEERAKELGDVAIEVFKNNFGGSVEEAGAAVAEAERQLGSLGTVGDEELQKLTEGAFAIRDVFGAEIGGSEGVISASKTLMEKFGLSGQEALDFISSGFQQGLNSSGDFLASVTEYGTQFSSGGATASEFFSIMKSGMQQGMLGTDKAADAFKEFRVRIQDGSSLTADSLEMIGINSEQLAADMASGAVTASEAFGMVTNALRQVDDQSVVMQAGVGLLGTQFEDLGTEGALALDLTATSMEDLAGSTDSLNAKYNNFGSLWEGIKRKALIALVPIGDKLFEMAQSVMPLVESALSWFETALPPILDNVSQAVARVADGFKFVIEIAQESGFKQIFAVFEDGTSYISGFLQALGVGTDTANLLGNTVANMATTIITFITGQVVPALQQFGNWFMAEGWPAIMGFAGQVVAFVLPILQQLGNWIQSQVLPALQQFGDWFMTEGWPALQQFASQVIAQVIPGLEFLAATAMNIASAVLPLLVSAWQLITENMNIVWPILAAVGAVILALNAPITAIIGAIVLLATAWANNWGGIQEKVMAVWAFIQPMIMTAITTIQTTIQTFLTAVQEWWTQHGDSVVTIIQGAWDFIQSTIMTVAGLIQSFWATWGDTIIANASLTWDTIKTVVSTAMTVIGGIIDMVSALIRGDWSAFGDALQRVWTAIWDGIGRVIDNSIEQVINVIGTLIDQILEFFDPTQMIEAGKDFVWGLIDGIKETIGELMQTVKDMANDVVDAIADVFGIGSPSRVMDDFGHNIDKSFADSITDNQDMPVNAMANMASTTISKTFNQTINNNGSARNSEGEFAQMVAVMGT